MKSNTEQTHVKQICQRCWQFNEKSWKSTEDLEWDNGKIICPSDCLEDIVSGKIKNLLGFICCSHSIFDPIPDWCQFKDQHALGMLKKEGS